MIPYEELVHALAEWRGRQGLGPAPTRAARMSAPAPAPAPAAPAFAPPAPVLPAARGGYATGPAASIAPPVAAAAAGLDDFEGEGTEIRDEGLGDEIDVDAEAVDVIEEHIDEE